MNTRMAPEVDIEKKPVLTAKPYKHIEKLINTLLPLTERRILSRGEVVHYYHHDDRQCFYSCRAA
ncbi:hypothetical protein M2429_000917 [Enterobacter sp. A4]